MSACSWVMRFCSMWTRILPLISCLILNFTLCHLLLFLQKHLQIFRRCLCIPKYNREAASGRFSVYPATFYLRACFYASAAASVSVVTSSAASTSSQKSSTTSASASAALSSLICFASAKISPAFS